MMNAIQVLLNDIKKRVAEFNAPAPEPTPEPTPTPTEFSEVKTQDGKVYSVDNLEVGGIMKEGDAVAADGTYTLEDGTTVTVTDGAIAEIMPLVGSSELEDLESELKATNQELAATKTELASVKASLVEVKAQAEAQQKNTSELMVKMSEAIEHIANGTPIEKPIEKTNHKTEMASKRFDALGNFAESFKK